MRRVILAAILSLAACFPASADVRIVASSGGEVTEYLRLFALLRQSGERIVIGNTGGRGAVLRADPVTGRLVAALREQQVLDVLERRNIPGSGDWVRVRTSDGQEGWVTGLVALQAPAAN